MNKSPAFQFYPADFLADENVLLMSNQEIGCYMKLMCFCWREGSIPSSLAKIARLCNEPLPEMEKLWPGISPCFEEDLENPERLTHERLNKERIKQEERRANCGESGSKGATGKWGALSPDKAKRSERLASARRLATHSPAEWQALKGLWRPSRCLRCGIEGDNLELVKDHIKPIYQGGSDGIDNIQPLCRKCNSSKGAENKDFRPSNWKQLMMSGQAPGERLANAWQMGGSSSSSSITTNNKKTKAKKEKLPKQKGSSLRFEEFWTVYPKRVGKKQAVEQWELKHLDNLADVVIEDVKKKIAEDVNWQDPKFVKDPERYLKHERWKDEIIRTSETGGQLARPGAQERKRPETKTEMFYNSCFDGLRKSAEQANTSED